MSLDSEYLFVSAYGRNLWLASELAKRGAVVRYIDCTNSFGWVTEDWLGPYGAFKHKSVDPSYLEMLQELVLLEESPVGFSFLFKEGPLDFKSSLSHHLMDKFKISSEVRNYLSDYYLPVDLSKRSEFIYRAKEEMAYDDLWLAHFAHLIFSQAILPNNQGVFSEESLAPLMSTYFLANARRESLERSLDWARENGVQIYSQEDLSAVSFSFEKKRRLVFTKSQKPQKTIWGLTSSESYHVSQELSAKLFDGYVDPDWAWVRWSLKVTEENQSHFHFKLPTITLISDRDLSLTHENFLFLNKTAVPLFYNLWSLAPHQMIWNTSYMEDQWKKMKAVLSKKWSGEGFELQHLPMSVGKQREEFGPSPFVKFTGFYQNSQRVKMTCENVELSQPEVWQRSDWHGKFLFEKQLLEKVLKEQGA